jgi:hypothetical protein
MGALSNIICWGIETVRHDVIARGPRDDAGIATGARMPAIAAWDIPALADMENAP